MFARTSSRLALVLGGTLLALLAVHFSTDVAAQEAAPKHAAPQAAQAPAAKGAAELTPDETYVIAAGMTEEEAKAWKLAGELAGAFFELPDVHPMEKQEVATAIHVVQSKLLARPTYRKYLELAKAGHEAGKKERNEGGR